MRSVVTVSSRPLVKEVSTCLNRSTGYGLSIISMALAGDETALFSGPPDVQIPVASLNELLTCNICLGYLHNAVTITECLHTFCKGCLVKYINYSLHCPKCKVLIHPTDPLVNIRPDSTMQDILYKLLPRVEKAELEKEKEFYEERGMAIPRAHLHTSKSSIKRCNRFRRKGSSSSVGRGPSWLAIVLLYVGASWEVEERRIRDLEPLVKNYLWLPANVKIVNIQNFIRKKLSLDDFELPILFIDNFLLHESLSLSTISNAFFNGLKEKMLTLNYRIVANKDYFADDVELDDMEIGDNDIAQDDLTTAHVADVEETFAS